MWRLHDEGTYPLLVDLSRHFASLSRSGPQTFPSFFGRTVYIASDYSGGSTSSEFFVISLLLVEIDAIDAWDIQRRHIRATHLKDNRRMSFKDLGDRRRQAALAEFLRAADSLSGILVSFAIHKSVGPLFTTIGDLQWGRRALGLTARWKQRAFEKMARVAALVTFLCGGLVHDDQDIVWVTDDDDFTGPPDRMHDVAAVLRMYRAINHPTHRAEAIVQAVSATPNDRYSMFFEDLCSIADLSAGCLAECCTESSRQNELALGIELPVDLSGASAKSREIFTWHANEHVGLKRLMCVLAPGVDNTHYQVGTVRSRPAG